MEFQAAGDLESLISSVLMEKVIENGIVVDVVLDNLLKLLVREYSGLDKYSNDTVGSQLVLWLLYIEQAVFAH